MTMPTRRLWSLKEEKNYTFVHPFDNEDVIAGQGTIGLEILDQMADVDAVIVPIGGGGLISGVAFAIKQPEPEYQGLRGSGKRCTEHARAPFGTARSTCLGLTFPPLPTVSPSRNQANIPSQYVKPVRGRHRDRHRRRDLRCNSGSDRNARS